MCCTHLVPVASETPHDKRDFILGVLRLDGSPHVSERNKNYSSSRNEGQSRAGGAGGSTLARPGHRCRSDVDTTACNQS